MSHYLEHMLFMGSEKFPDENEYDSYLQHHGGSSNAYTEMVREPDTCTASATQQ
jgi:nardilysin